MTRRACLAFLLLIEAVSAGVAPDPDAKALQDSLDAASASHTDTFHIPSKTFYFGTSPLLIKDAQHLSITAQGGTELWFAIGGGVMFERCHNVSFTGDASTPTVIDYWPPSHMQATAQSDAVVTPALNASHRAPMDFTVTIKPDLGFAAPDTFYQTYSTDPESEFVQGPQWWGGPDMKLLYSAFNSFNATSQIRPGPPGSGTFVYSASAGSVIPKKGDKVTAVIRKGFTWLVHNSSAVSSSHVTIHSTSFMAITEFDGTGGNSYNDVNVVRRTTSVGATCGPPGRSRLCLSAVSSNADVFHSSGVRYGPTVTGCEWSYAMDDYLNVHSRSQVNGGVVSTGASHTSVLILDPRLALDNGIPDDMPYGVVETMTNAHTGMHLVFRDPLTLLEITRAEIVAQPSRVPMSDPLFARAVTLAHNVNNELHETFKTLNVTGSGVGSRVWVVDVDVDASVPVTTLDKPCLVELAEWNAAGAVVANNYFHDSIDGVRWKSSNGIFESNRWSPAVSLTGLEVTPLRMFLEGPLAIDNVTIRDNIFVGGSPSLISNCTGMSHSAKPNFRSCTHIYLHNNTYPPTY